MPKHDAETPDLLPDHLPGPDGVPRILGRDQALALGFTRHAIAHRLETRRWHRVLPHTYLTGHTLTWADRQDAALAFAGSDALLTSGAALADLGLRCVTRPDRMLVLVPPSCRVRPTGWVRVRRTTRMPSPAAVPGPRRADLSRCVADLAAERQYLDDVRALVSEASRLGLCSLEQLRVELAEGPRRHSAHLRQALLDADRGAWSAPEGRAATILRRSAFPDFEQNVPIRLPDGRTLIVDFLWRALRAVLEIDSDEHHWNSPGDRDATTRRQSALMTAGFATISRRPGLVRRRPQEFTRDVEAWLTARTRELAVR
ncbi:hypothetical protein [uncultured Jatrophihabitans sp.]|uniref:hypothetical protein n=1 Tax=uncultured Jatrophihabitans sp. TaxID=1610747 RepID=UPI0035C97E72